MCVYTTLPNKAPCSRIGVCVCVCVCVCVIWVSAKLGCSIFTSLHRSSTRNTWNYFPTATFLMCGLGK